VSRLRRVWLPTIALALGAACQSATGTVRDGPVIVTSRPDALVIANAGSDPVYTFALTQEASALVDWIPCSDPTRCQGIAQGATRVVPYSQIYDYSRGTRAVIIYWWHLVPSGNGFAPDEIRAVVVQL
jgi:hypothetical protein